MLKIKWMLLEPEDDVGFQGGGGGYSDDDDDLLPLEDNSQTQSQSQQTQQSPAFDPEALARANAAALEPILARYSPQQQGQVVDPTQAFQQATKLYKPDAGFIKQLFDPAASDEQRAQALSEMIDGMNQHLYAVMGMAFKEQVVPLRQQFTNYQQSQLSQVHEGQKRSFISGLLTAKPEVKEYARVVEQVVGQMQVEGYSPVGKTEAERLRSAQIETLRRTRDLIRTVQPEFNFKSATSAGGAGRSGMPRQASMAGAGGVGNGRVPNGRSGGAAPANWERVLGNK